jgi:hypothetical protein
MIGISRIYINHRLDMKMRKMKQYTDLMFVLIRRKPEFLFCGGGFWDMIAPSRCSPVRRVPPNVLDLGDAVLVYCCGVWMRVLEAGRAVAVWRLGVADDLLHGMRLRCGGWWRTTCSREAHLP